MSDQHVRELIIIGGGPAGYTAALYAARADLEPLVIEGFAWGGQLMITSDVENYPGYPDGVMGPEMMSDFRRQAERFGAEYVTDDVTRVDFSEQPLRVWVGNDEYAARSVIVATGASARWLGIESEEQHKGRGVSACATCDASFFREKDVYVVGGGDSAFEEALFLTKFASRVHLVHRRNDFRASRIMVDRAEANEKLDFVRSAEVVEILGDEKVQGLRLRSTENGERVGGAGRRALRRDRARPEHRPLRRPARARRGRLPRHEGGIDRDECAGRVRGRRRAGPHLPAGDHRGRLGLYGGARRRAVPRRDRRSSGHRGDSAAHRDRRRRRLARRRS